MEASSLPRGGRLIEARMQSVERLLDFQRYLRLFARLNANEFLAQGLEDRLECEEVLRPVVDQQDPSFAHWQHNP